MATLIDCCNRALAQVGAGSIASLDDGTIEARECTRFAADLIAEISGWHEWAWAIVSTSLAEIANDRPFEWLHAYGLPSDMERPLVVRRDETSESQTDIIPDGMWPDTSPWRPILGNFPFPAQDATPIAFIIEGATLYTNVASAILHYFQVVTDISATPPMVARAFELELASRIVMPLRKDPQLQQAISQKAEVARQRAIADDINRHPRPHAIFTSDAALARLGMSDWT
jgi:hypothetical protein